MAIITFFYDNKWNGASGVGVTSEQANFPGENTQLRDFNEPWRSNYGASSGWGYFEIIASENDRLDFTDSHAATVVASLTAAAYTADTLAVHIKAQMDAVSADTWTVEYLESGADANKFKITSDNDGGAGSVSLLWSTGANSARAVTSTIGFHAPSGDSTGALTYTANFVRIHTIEAVSVDLGSAMAITGVMIKGHNFQSDATIKVQGSANNFSTTPIDQSMTWQADIMAYQWSSAETYQYWRFTIVDIDNPATYVEIGAAFVGPEFQPDINFLNKSRITKKVDQSIVKRSEGGQISTIQLDDYEVWQYLIRVKGSSDYASFNTMFDEVKKSKPLFICEDPDNLLTTIYYCQFVDFEWNPIYEVIDLYELPIQVEELI